MPFHIVRILAPFQLGSSLSWRAMNGEDTDRHPSEDNPGIRFLFSHKVGPKNGRSIAMDHNWA